MLWLKRIVALTLLALWMPATMHCQLEAIPELSFLACGDETDSPTHQETDCEGDACASVESGDFFSRQESTAADHQVSSVELVLAPFICAAQPTPPVTASAGSTSPPELSTSWQFSSRAAPSPRAPSSVA